MKDLFEKKIEKRGRLKKENMVGKLSSRSTQCTPLHRLNFEVEMKKRENHPVNPQKPTTKKRGEKAREQKLAETDEELRLMSSKKNVSEFCQNAI